MHYLLDFSASYVNFAITFEYDKPYCDRRKKCQIILKIKQKLARKLLCELCANMVESLKKIIFSEQFLAHHRQSDKNFVRNRILPFSALIFFLMNLIKGSLQDELDYFFKALNNLDVAARKLDQLDSVQFLDELRIPPGNKLEALSGNREGEYSIRINDQYRSCFKWTEAGPDLVEITDYH